jgi:hypothetical protein
MNTGVGILCGRHLQSAVDGAAGPSGGRLNKMGTRERLAGEQSEIGLDYKPGSAGDAAAHIGRRKHAESCKKNS